MLTKSAISTMRPKYIYIYSPKSPSAETFPSASIVRNLPVSDRKRQTVVGMGVGAAKANAIIDSTSETVVGIFIVSFVYSAEETSTAAILSESKNATFYTQRKIPFQLKDYVTECAFCTTHARLRVCGNILGNPYPQDTLPGSKEEIEYDPMLGFQFHVLRKSSSFLHVNSW